MKRGLSLATLVTLVTMIALVLGALATTAPVIFADDGATTLQEQQRRGRRGGRRGGNADSEDEKKPKKDEPKIKPYADVITDKAKSDEGIFTVHRIDDKLFYEIPTAQLGKEFVLVTRIARTTLGVGYGGQKLGTRVVRWDRRGDRILLNIVSYSVVADSSRPIARAVADSNNNTGLKTFEIKALGPKGKDSVVIDVTALYTSDIHEMSAKQRLQASSMDGKRSFVDEALAFPTNIEIRASHTYVKRPDPPGRSAPTPTRRSRFGRGMRAGSATVVIHYSMVKLPDNPMMPRLYDERVGYFTASQTDYGRDEHRAVQRRYITRWRLEKKDPSKELSEPIEPIVYWIDPATPAKWVPYMKRGVEKWQEAFEEAGFKNAIIAKEAPTPEEDPEWHPEDARYSVMRWLPSNIPNASGPHVHDPRTGQILESDIQFYHNVQSLARNWYFVQVGALDPRARQLPMPDDLMGELIEYVAAHEIGHTLGFQHNMKASSMYTVEQVRDPEWVRTMSHVATLMDYSRYNYVAQPEDGIAIEDLIPKIGPYDKWATMWGYKPIPDAKSPDEEKATLDEWARQQDETPWLRFTTGGRNPQGHDPGELTEAVGDSDAVRATELGVKNLKRVMEYLIPTTTRDGENWDDLETYYGAVLGQWVREMGHVAAIVGGFDSQEKHGGQDGVLFTPVSRERQAGAVAFLNANAFTTPDYFIRPEVLRRIEASGVIARINSSQNRVLNSLLSASRLGRLVEQNSIDGASTYQATDFLADVRTGIWSEIKSANITVDAYRRALQRSYLDVLDTRLNGSRAVGDDTRALFRGELNTLRGELTAAAKKTSDTATRYHLQDSVDRIARILDPKFRPGSSAAGGGRGGRIAYYEALEALEMQAPEFCWPELIITPEN